MVGKAGNDMTNFVTFLVQFRPLARTGNYKNYRGYALYIRVQYIRLVYKLRSRGQYGSWAVAVKSYF